MMADALNMLEDFPCRECGHSWNAHIIAMPADTLATNETVPMADRLAALQGYMTCPVEGCECYLTVSVGRPTE